METLFSLTLFAGIIAFWVGLLIVVICIAKYLFMPSTDRQGKSLMHFLAIATIISVVAFVVGATVGGFVFCSGMNHGNLCGLSGWAGTAPLLWSVLVGRYAVLWLKGNRGPV